MNTCSASPGSKVLVIAFEGTGAYEPIISETISQFGKCFGGNLDKKLVETVYRNSVEIFKREFRRSPKWSGLQTGIQQEALSLKNSKNVDWYSFPSEELEQLAGLEELKRFSLRELVRNIRDSVGSNPKGIQNARRCIISYLNSARELEVKPHVVFVSHSSGARSLVKLSEHMKNIKIDLLFTIDAIKEAHEAFKEVLPQKLSQPTRQLAWVLRGKRGEAPYCQVHSKYQRSSLYKPSNVVKHLNYFQYDDRLGLKIGGNALKFAIKGSPMVEARNRLIKNLSISGHGEIAYNYQVLKDFSIELEQLLKKR